MHSNLLALLSLAALAACVATEVNQSTSPTLDYPDARRDDVVDDYHGTQVPDPYRWLEDPDSDETRAWINAQNRITRAFLDAVPQREALRDKLETLWDYERFGLPRRRGDAYYYSYNDGLMDQSVLVRARTLGGETEIVLDPRRFSEDGTVSLGGMAFSEDGGYLAYGLSDGGSDWLVWRVRDLETGQDLPDTLDWVKFSSPAWTHDAAGFFYGRYPEVEDRLTAQNVHQKLYYHRLGEPQTRDELIFEEPEHERRGFGSQVTEDGRFLVLSVWEGTERKNRLYVKDLEDARGSIVRTLDAYDAEYQVIGNSGWTFWLQTDKDAPRGRIVRVDASAPEPELVEVVAEGKDRLEDASLVGDRLLVTYLEDAHSAVRVFSLDGTPQGQVELPGIGSAGGFAGRKDDPETFYAYSSFTTPPTVYRYDVRSGESTLFQRPQLDFDPSPYVTEQVFYASQDGTRVPLFITRRADLEPTGDTPTILYGYGGFDISMRPGFRTTTACWLDMGGIYAVACLRGGGEYGRDWHEAGTLTRKQNVFDDFHAAAEWLIDAGWTRPQRLAIHGGSNGGLLVGACMIQRPELYGAALPAVGVMDMLRYHLWTIGWAWASDYGTSAEADMFPVLHGYSPLHNLREGVDYPATLVTTADHDDRVVPAHSFKFAAALQHAHGGDDPVLISIDTRAGHGAGRSTTQEIEEAADRFAFLVRVLGMDPELPTQP